MNTLKFFSPVVYNKLPFDIFDRLLTDSVNETNFTTPSTNVIEEEDQFRIEVALPGYSREQISMNYLKNVLTIKSNIGESTTEEKKYLSREFGQKNFSKQFVIPRTLDAEKITAEFTNGILLISIPKREEAKVKEPIEVQIH